MGGMEAICCSIEMGSFSTLDPPILSYTQRMSTWWSRPLYWFPISEDWHIMQGTPPWPPQASFVRPTFDGAGSILGPSARSCYGTQFWTLSACGDIQRGVPLRHMSPSSSPRWIESGLVSLDPPVWRSGGWSLSTGIPQRRPWKGW